MKKLKLFNTYNFLDRFGSKVYCRVFTVNGIPEYVFVERTIVRNPNKQHGTHRSWYMPTVGQYKAHLKSAMTGKHKQYEDLGGTAGLSYWFNLLRRKGYKV